VDETLKPSRSIQRRLAAQKGEPTPRFDAPESAEGRLRRFAASMRDDASKHYNQRRFGGSMWAMKLRACADTVDTVLTLLDAARSLHSDMYDQFLASQAEVSRLTAALAAKDREIEGLKALATEAVKVADSFVRCMVHTGSDQRAADGRVEKIRTLAREAL
jgi:hypothetical protein